MLMNCAHYILGEVRANTKANSTFARGELSTSPRKTACVMLPAPPALVEETLLSTAYAADFPLSLSLVHIRSRRRHPLLVPPGLG